MVTRGSSTQGSRSINRSDELELLLPLHEKGQKSPERRTVKARMMVVVALCLIGIMLGSLPFIRSSLSQTYDESVQETWAPIQILANETKNDTPIWQELEPPQMWSLSLGHNENQTWSYEHTIDFQSLKYGGPSATLNEVSIVEVSNFGCNPMDHEAVASRIAIIQEGSQDCDLWMAASNAAKAGALAVLFHSFSPDDSLLSSPLLPQGWELGDPLIPIPVLSVTHALGLTLLGNQSNMLLSIVTRNLMDEKEEHNGDDTIFGKIIATFHYIMGTISSTCNHIIDTIFAAVTWLWEYSKAVTLFVAAAFVPIALNAASSLATKTIEFGFKGVYATTLAVMGIFGRLFQMSRKSKATIPPNEGQAQAGEHVETTILSRGMFAPEREAAKSVNTAEIPQNHPIFNIYFVGASFIVGLVVGGCFAVAVMAATRPTPV